MREWLLREGRGPMWVTGIMSSVLRGFSASSSKEPSPAPSAQLKQARLLGPWRTWSGLLLAQTLRGHGELQHHRERDRHGVTQAREAYGGRARFSEFLVFPGCTLKEQKAGQSQGWPAFSLESGWLAQEYGLVLSLAPPHIPLPSSNSHHMPW